jgi:uncharacterized glyoxalase superfamily protein PhnB
MFRRRNYAELQYRVLINDNAHYMDESERAAHQDNGLAAKYGVMVDPPEDRPWGLRDFVIVDPTGVLWRIGQSITDTHQETAG